MRNHQLYLHTDLIAFAFKCLTAAGLKSEMASVVARRILDADLSGHDTHGLALLPRYLTELEEGKTAKDGTIETVSSRGACLTWDAGMLPGHWVLEQAFETAIGLVPAHGLVSIAVRRSQHVGALQVYLNMATERGYMCLLWVTDSKVRSVAPPGGLDAVLTSEPIAAGIPTRSAPILVDTTTSLTSNNFVKQAQMRGERLPWPALLSAEGKASDDPAVLSGEHHGTILPLGGITHGHKGYAIAMIVSALSLGLPGLGRVSGEKAQGFFLQIIDPDAFGGRDVFLDEADWMANATRAARPIDPARPVRVPGDGARARIASQMAAGVAISAEIRKATESWATRHGIAFPDEISRAAEAAQE
jgi:LDH2 family malate/lactate/ureidoglycolate dehydrogenase